MKDASLFFQLCMFIFTLLVLTMSCHEFAWITDFISIHDLIPRVGNDLHLLLLLFDRVQEVVELQDSVPIPLSFPPPKLIQEVLLPLFD